MFIFCRREGTTEDQDNLAHLETEGSGGSGEDPAAATALRLAENLATLTDFSYLSKRNHISRPDTTSPETPKKRSPKVKSDGINATEPSTTKSTGAADRPQNTTSTSTEKIDESVAKVVKEHFHMKPNVGMHIQCKVPGKPERMKGTLQFLGHIPNLPRRTNVIVAGIQLEADEDLATDGTFLGKRYFSTAPKRGYFVPYKNCMLI